MTLASIVSGFAPILGTALGGPLGGIVGTLIATVFGGDIKKPDELASMISADPDAAVKLKQIEEQHKEAILASQLQTIQADDADTANARAMAVATKDNMPKILTITIFGAYLINFIVVLLINVFYKENNTDIAITKDVMNILGMGVGMALQYWFGSSHSERRAMK